MRSPRNLQISSSWVMAKARQFYAIIVASLLLRLTVQSSLVAIATSTGTWTVLTPPELENLLKDKHGVALCTSMIFFSKSTQWAQLIVIAGSRIKKSSHPSSLVATRTMVTSKLNWRIVIWSKKRDSTSSGNLATCTSFPRRPSSLTSLLSKCTLLINVLSY